MRDFFEYVWLNPKNDFVRKRQINKNKLDNTKTKIIILFSLFVVGVILLGLFLYKTLNSSFNEAFKSYWYLLIFGSILSFGAYAPYKMLRLKNDTKPNLKDNNEKIQFDEYQIISLAKDNNLIENTMKLSIDNDYLYIDDTISLYGIARQALKINKEEGNFIVEDKEYNFLYRVIISSNDGDLCFFLNEEEYSRLFKAN